MKTTIKQLIAQPAYLAALLFTIAFGVTAIAILINM